MSPHLNIIINATRVSLNRERASVYPPLGDVLEFVQASPDAPGEFDKLGEIVFDWTISFDREENRNQYVCEILETRRLEIPADWGQSSYLRAAGGAILFQAIEFSDVQSADSLNDPFVHSQLRPTLKIFCAIVDQSAINDE